jgi:hypothetical protein
MPLVDALRLDQVTLENPPLPGNPNQVLLTRARALSNQDRLMIELAFAKNLSVRQIARLLHRPPGSVSRRLHRLCKRLRDPIVAALLQHDCPLSPTFKQIAMEYFAQGVPTRHIALNRDMTRLQIRSILTFIRGWYRGVHIRDRRECALV